MIVFFDFETYSEVNIKDVGAVAYARHPSTRPVCMAYAVNAGPVEAWEAGQPIPPALLTNFYDSAMFVAHNAIFDRNVWNNCEPFKHRPLRPSRVLCSMAQAEGSSLPGALGLAAEALRAPHKKNKDGKKLMNKFCSPGGEGTPEEWARFVQYCKDDVAAMREVWLRSRRLTANEWTEYHASEVINDNGLLVDVDFARKATELAEFCAVRAHVRLVDITGDLGMTAKTYLRHQGWLRERLSPAQISLITDEEGKISVDKDSRRKLIEHADMSQECADFVQALDEAGGAAASKYVRIANMAGPDNRIRGSYVFNGAGQTGRFSSRGIQMHNIIRAPLKEGEPTAACDAIDVIMAKHPPEAVALLEETYKMPAPDVLARLIRPTVIAPEGKQLVWGDYSAIEARVLPWLSGSKGGEAKLDLFRRNEDVYKRAYADMYGIKVEDVIKPQRAIGKVVELALGYQGGWRALRKMARDYGLDFEEGPARDLVNRWRAANPWAVRFWADLNDAAKECIDSPGVRIQVGRLSYVYQTKLMGGTLVCILPSGRVLCYPRARIDTEQDDEGRNYRDVTYMKFDKTKGYRNGLYGGLLAENATQAAAGCLLRGKLVELVEATQQSADAKVVGHTHDEIMLEVPNEAAPAWIETLKQTTERNPPWADGLPLKVEVEHGPFWTK